MMVAHLKMQEANPLDDRLNRQALMRLPRQVRFNFVL